MDMLRWVLLLIGVAAVIGLFLYSRYRKAGANATPWKRGIRHAADDEIQFDDADLDEIAGAAWGEPVFDRDGFDEAPLAQAGDDPDAFTVEPVQPSRRGVEAAGTGEQMSLQGLQPQALQPQGLQSQEEEAQLTAKGRGQGKGARGKKGKAATAEKSAVADDTQEKIIVLYLTAQKNRVFSGAHIVQAMQALGLRHGDKQIFHYFSPAGGSEAVFGVANILEPGWFELSAMDGFSTPGLVLFLQLPGPVADLQAFELFIAKARELQSLLGGELKDDSRHALNGQMINHLRDQVQGFTRQRKMSFT